MRPADTSVPLETESDHFRPAQFRRRPALAPTIRRAHSCARVRLPGSTCELHRAASRRLPASLQEPPNLVRFASTGHVPVGSPDAPAAGARFRYVRESRRDAGLTTPPP